MNAVNFQFKICSRIISGSLKSLSKLDTPFTFLSVVQIISEIKNKEFK